MTGPPVSVAVPPLHVVTDDRVLADPGFAERADRVVAAGGASLALHLRGPATPGRRLHDLARALRPGTRAAGALLLVNDRVDVAAALDLDGVQLGERSLPVAEARRLLPPDATVGVSVHDPERAVAAARAGADFLVVGTIFATSSHPDREPAGTGLLSGVRDRVDAPLVAIGGLTPGRVGPALRAGAAGVAVLGGVWGADDPAAAVGRYLEALAAAGATGGRPASPGAAGRGSGPGETGGTARERG